MKELLKTFPVVTKIPVIWGDMDSFQHVNNVIYFRYFESARIQYFETLGWLKIIEKMGIGPIEDPLPAAIGFPSLIRILYLLVQK